MIEELTMFACLKNYCRANSLDIKVKNMYFSKHVTVTIPNEDFSRLEKLLNDVYPDVVLYYAQCREELIDFEFNSKQSLSHFVLAWS